jgi:Gas vesicle synthesis protein GvpL/GvpF
MSPSDDLGQRLSSAIDEFADLEAGDLLAEARVEARAKARSMLAEAMAERLLERVHAVLAGEVAPDPAGSVAKPAPSKRTARKARASAAADRSKARKRPAPARPRRAASARTDPRAGAGSAWYVYCVIGAGELAHPLDATDEGPNLEIIREGVLAAVTSEVSLEEFDEEALRERLNDLEWLERRARTHEHVVDSVREVTAVVPMRLCTIYRTQQAVRKMLAREQVFLADALSRLAGRAEWGVKIFAGTDQVGGAAGSQRDETRADDESGPGEAYLMGRRRQREQAQDAARLLQHRCEAAHDRLAAGAAEARLNPPQSSELADHPGRMVLNGVYLVDDDRTDEFVGSVAGMRDEYASLGLDVELTGPWPPYNFVNAAVEVER